MCALGDDSNLAPKSSSTLDSLTPGSSSYPQSYPTTILVAWRSPNQIEFGAIVLKLGEDVIKSVGPMMERSRIRIMRNVFWLRPCGLKVCSHSQTIDPLCYRSGALSTSPTEPRLTTRTPRTGTRSEQLPIASAPASNAHARISNCRSMPNSVSRRHLYGPHADRQLRRAKAQ
jgi:hypothetical protein